MQKQLNLSELQILSTNDFKTKKIIKLVVVLLFINKY